MRPLHFVFSSNSRAPSSAVTAPETGHSRRKKTETRAKYRESNGEHRTNTEQKKKKKKHRKQSERQKKKKRETGPERNRKNRRDERGRRKTKTQKAKNRGKEEQRKNWRGVASTRQHTIVSFFPSKPGKLLLFPCMTITLFTMKCIITFLL